MNFYASIGLLKRAQLWYLSKKLLDVKYDKFTNPNNSHEYIDLKIEILKERNFIKIFQKVYQQNWIGTNEKNIK